MKHIGKYALCGLLGRGGMGHVYKARIPVVDKIVALKLCRPSEQLLALKSEQEIRQEFIREARIMARISHPHVAQVWDFDYDAKGHPFFVMEYHCDNLGAAIGESYRHDIPTRRLRPDRAVRYTLQTLSGLARLHHAGVIHRDIKPYNLLLTELDRVKIIDFGLSRLRNERTAPSPAGVKIGTPFYAAPEQEAAPEKADHRADLYAAGVMLFRMLAGELPTQATGEALSTQARAALHDLNAQSNTDWSPFFSTALAKAPGKRFAHAEDMANALETLLEAWQTRQEAACRADFDTPPVACSVSPGAGRTLRSAPVKTGPVPAHQAFDTDALARPRSTAPDYETLPGGVADKTHGLHWQASGSVYPIRWDEIPDYLARLNATAHTAPDWRLPTVDELAGLVAKASEEADFCGASPFDTRQRLLWSADRRTFSSAWCLNLALGFVDWRDTTCRCWVRAVRELSA